MDSQQSGAPRPKTRRKWGLGPQSALLCGLLLAPIPAYLAAEARLDGVAGAALVMMAVVMIVVVAKS